MLTLADPVTEAMCQVAVNDGRRAAEENNAVLERSAARAMESAQVARRPVYPMQSLTPDSPCASPEMV